MERRYNRELKKIKRKKLFINLLVLSVVCLLLFLFVIYPFFNIKTRKYEVKKTNIPQSFNNYKIIQVSDLYLKGSDNLSKLKEVISKANPNLVVFTGNIFTREDPDFYKNFLDMKNEISESLLFYISMGQTELELGEDYIARLSEKLKTHGIYILDEKKIELNKGGEVIYVQAISPKKDDYKLTDSKVNIDNKITFDDKHFNLVLSHNPSYAQKLSESGADLILSGSRNGGWIRLPFIGGVSYDYESKFKEDDYILGENLLIVSRGTGIKEGRFRLFNTKEINEIILKR